MTHQENLPIWAKILLGIPVTGESADNNRAERAVSSRHQTPAPSEPQDHEQSVLVFDPRAGKRKRGWRALLCPVPGKLRS